MAWNMQDLKQNKAPKGALQLPQAEQVQNSDTQNVTWNNPAVNAN